MALVSPTMQPRWLLSRVAGIVPVKPGRRSVSPRPTASNILDQMVVRKEVTAHNGAQGLAKSAMADSTGQVLDCPCSRPKRHVNLQLAMNIGNTSGVCDSSRLRQQAQLTCSVRTRVIEYGSEDACINKRSVLLPHRCLHVYMHG